MHTGTPSQRRAVDAIAALAALAAFYHQFRILIGSDIELMWQLESAAYRGEAAAPDQYRLLVPWLTHALVETVGLAPPLANHALNAVALMGGFLVLLPLVWRQGLSAVPVALYVALYGFGLLIYPRPEMFVAFFAVGIAARGLFATTTLARVGLSLAGAIVLVLTRPDLAVAFGLCMVLRWTLRRDRIDVALGACIVLGAGAGTLMIMRAYPDASYEVETIQLLHNLTSTAPLVAAVHLAPVVLPIVWAVRAHGFNWVTPTEWSVLAWLLSEFSFNMLIGRVGEVRLWFPLAGLAALVAARAWGVGRSATLQSADAGSEPDIGQRERR